MFFFLNKWKYIILLFLVELILLLTNYIPGTYLAGWDNLYPELNFSENLRRSIYSIWQEYRGLGLLDGMAHGANFVHTLWVFLLSIFLPQSVLRYVTHFFLHFIGGVGIYLLIEKLLKRAFDSQVVSHNLQPIALLGALFYQYNITTVQMFYTPLEVFSFHFAFLPILIYFILDFLGTGRKRSFLLFFLFSLLSIPQAFVPSIFIVYFLAVLTVLGFYLLKKENRKESVRRSFLILVMIFFVNAHWVLPYFYSTIHASKTFVNSKINQMATDNIVARNKEFGDFISVALLRGFLLDYVDYQPNGENDYMMSVWRNHLHSPLIFLLSFVFFFICLSGLIFAVIKKRRCFYPFVALFMLSFLILGSDIPIISLFLLFLQKFTPFFYDAFRFTFTKFSILYAFCYSILFAYGLGCIISSSIFRRGIGLLFLSGLYFSLFIYTSPSFKGNFIYSNLKVKIPLSYFRLIDYLKKQDKNTRLATLPQPSYWGWIYYQWGVRGSGFLWYGLPQATMDGAFYPWSREDENYYWEITQALYSSNGKMFENVFEKYQIKYLLVDHSIISPFSPKAVYIDQLEEMITKSEKFHLASTFGKINVYEVNLKTKPNNFIFLAQDLPVVGPEYKWSNYDKAYEEYGNYISSSQLSLRLRSGQAAVSNQLSVNNETVKPADAKAMAGEQFNNVIYYPFRSLFTGRKQEELEFEVEDTKDYFSFKTQIPKELVGGKLVIPALNKEEVTEINENDFANIIEKFPQIFLDGELISVSSTPGESSSATPGVSISPSTPQVSLALPYIHEGNLEVRVPRILGYYSYNLEPFDFAQDKPKNCNQFDEGVYKHAKVRLDGKDLLRLTSIGSSNCLDFDLPRLSQRLGYLVTIESRNVEGKSLLFSVVNRNSQRADLETYLPKRYTNSSTVRGVPSTSLRANLGGVLTAYFVIPPMEQYGLGYTLHIDNMSIGRVKTINDLGKITVNPIPYRFLTSLKIVKGNSNPQPTTYNSQLISVDHPNPSLYQVTFTSSTIGGVMASPPEADQPATPEVSLSQTNNVTLVLSQSFDPGWKAYEITNDWFSDSWYMKLLIPFFQPEIKDHVLVNNWQNGWRLSNLILRQDSGQAMKQLSNEAIVIIYLPQYLQYLGFGLLLFVPVILWRARG